MTATAKQIGLIHGLKKRAGLDDDSYRGMLRQVAGVDSAKALSVDGAVKVIDRLKVLTGEVPAERGERVRQQPQARGALRLEGPYAAKMRALWIAGYGLGIVADRTDEGLAAFVKRQTGLDHPNWLRDDRQAVRVIEGLKSWIARETGFDWTERANLHEIKVRLVELAWRRALDCGAVKRNFMDALDLADFGAAIARRPSRSINDIVALADPELDRVLVAIGHKVAKRRRAA